MSGCADKPYLFQVFQNCQNPVQRVMQMERWQTRGLTSWRPLSCLHSIFAQAPLSGGNIPDICPYFLQTQMLVKLFSIQKRVIATKQMFESDRCGEISDVFTSNSRVYIRYVHLTLLSQKWKKGKPALKCFSHNLLTLFGLEVHNGLQNFQIVVH